MTDRQIRTGGTQDTPLDYTLPDSVAFIPKVLYAEYLDNGAASDWIPGVIIYSDANEIMAICADNGQVITAGDDADASFFPHVRGSSGSGSSGGAPDYLILQGTGQTITRPPVGDSDHAKFVYATRKTNADATFTYILDGGGAVKEVQSSTPGRYLSFCQFEWGNPVVSSTLTVVADLFSGFDPDVSPSASLVTADVWEGMVQGASNLASGTGIMDVIAAVDTGDASLAFDGVYWTILRWNT